MKLIIITIIKHHNSKHYIHSIFINTYDNYPCLLDKYRFKITRMLTKHFRSDLFDDNEDDQMNIYSDIANSTLLYLSLSFKHRFQREN